MMISICPASMVSYSIPFSTTKSLCRLPLILFFHSRYPSYELWSVTSIPYTPALSAGENILFHRYPSIHRTFFCMTVHIKFHIIFTHDSLFLSMDSLAGFLYVSAAKFGITWIDHLTVSFLPFSSAIPPCGMTSPFVPFVAQHPQIFSVKTAFTSFSRQQPSVHTTDNLLSCLIFRLQIGTFIRAGVHQAPSLFSLSEDYTVYQFLRNIFPASLVDRSLFSPRRPPKRWWLPGSRG